MHTRRGRTIRSVALAASMTISLLLAMPVVVSAHGRPQATKTTHQVQGWGDYDKNGSKDKDDRGHDGNPGNTGQSVNPGGKHRHAHWHWHFSWAWLHRR